MEPSHAKKLIVDYIEAYNRFDIAGMLVPLHEEVTFRNIASGEVNLTTHGKVDFRFQAEQATRYFSQREQRATAWEATGNRMEVLINYTATVAISLPNGIQPGDTLHLQGKLVFQFVDGKIIAIDDIS